MTTAAGTDFRFDIPVYAQAEAARAVGVSLTTREFGSWRSRALCQRAASAAAGDLAAVAVLVVDYPEDPARRRQTYLSYSSSVVPCRLIKTILRHYVVMFDYALAATGRALHALAGRRMAVGAHSENGTTDNY